MSQSRWNRCLIGAGLLVALAFVIGLVTVPAILNRPGLSAGPLAICGAWFLFLAAYGFIESRRG